MASVNVWDQNAVGVSNVFCVVESDSSQSEAAELRKISEILHLYRMLELCVGKTPVTGMVALVERIDCYEPVV